MSNTKTPTRGELAIRIRELMLENSNLRLEKEVLRKYSYLLERLLDRVLSAHSSSVK